MAHNLETLLGWATLHVPGDSLIASLAVRSRLEHDHDRGPDVSLIPEGLLPA